jgi:hypothetical protein
VTSESNRISAASIAYTDQVCRAWGWSWSEMGQADDDGLDGLIYLRTMEVNTEKPTDRRSWKHQFTGGLIHVQVKTGVSHVDSRHKDHLEIKIDNFEKKRELWMKSPLPVALLYIKDEPIGKSPSKGWWADLKSADSYTAKGTVIVPLRNRFESGLECRRPFSRLATGQHRGLGLAEIDMCIPAVLPHQLNTLKKSLKFAAWDFYKLWKSTGAMNPVLGKILINRTGWSHVTRVGRPVSRIQKSFELLPAAARMVAEIKTWQILRRGKTERTYPDKSWAIYDYLGISAMVKWPAREASEVMVILRRQTIFGQDPASTSIDKKIHVLKTTTWFYSVYEPGRGKTRT